MLRVRNTKRSQMTQQLAVQVEDEKSASNLRAQALLLLAPSVGL